jgi:endonuclease VIII
MPEGDTVWLAARNLRAALAGKPLVRSDFRVPRLATVDLVGRVVLDVGARGKHLLMRIEPDLTLHSHLRMDGSWHLYRPDARWSGGPESEVRVLLAVPDRIAVGYRLPVLELLPTADEHLVVGHLGPDLLADAFDTAEAVRRLRSDGPRAIGEALLDQRNVAGIGNLYRAEVLFLSGVSPWRSVAEVDSGDSQLDRIVDRARLLLRANAGRAAQVTTGDLRPGRTTWVYGRGGQPCRRCGNRVRQAEQGEPPYARITYWCPSCQP